MQIEIIASVILPDHVHYLFDTNGRDISLIMQRIKMSFGAIYRKRHNLKSGRLWQNRFWDHIIRDQDNFNNHVSYIHYNPVKHGYVKSPFNWIQSSIHEYFKNGYYRRDWGSREEIVFDGNYGDD